jgi:GTP-binding protein
VTAYALEGLADRGIMFVTPGDEVYSGQIVGEHNRENDIVANVVRTKHLTNIRSSTKEAFTTLKAARSLTLEGALEYIESDELVEVTPASIRLRKRVLEESQRRRAERAARDRTASAT